MPKKRPRPSDVNMKNFETNAKRRIEDWTLGFDLSVSQLEIINRMHVICQGQAYSEAFAVVDDEDVTNRLTRGHDVTFGDFSKPSFGVVASGVMTEFDCDGNFEDDLPASKTSFPSDDEQPRNARTSALAIRCDTLDSLRTTTASETSIREMSSPTTSEHDETDATRNKTPRPLSRKRIRICPLDEQTKLSRHLDARDPSSYVRVMKRRVIQDKRTDIICAPSWVPKGAAPALLDMWTRMRRKRANEIGGDNDDDDEMRSKKRRTREASDLEEIEILRGNDTVRSSNAMSLLGDTSAFADQDESNKSNKIVREDPSNDPVDFADHVERDDVDDSFSNDGRISSIGRVSDFPRDSVSLVDHVASLDESAIQMIRVLKRAGLGEYEDDAPVSLQDIIATLCNDSGGTHLRDMGLTKTPCRSNAHFAASIFSQILVLKSRDVVDVRQNAHNQRHFLHGAPVHDIMISRGPLFETEPIREIMAF